MWSEDEADDGKPSHPLARSTAWWISQSQQRGARFRTGTHAERRGMGATACSRNERLWNGRLWRKADIRGMSGFGTCYSAPSPRSSNGRAASVIEWRAG